jgi:hypothetical protein
MTSFIAALVAVVGISIGAALVLETQQRTADTAYATKGARVDLDPRLNGGVAPKH